MSKTSHSSLADIENKKHELDRVIEGFEGKKYETIEYENVSAILHGYKTLFDEAYRTYSREAGTLLEEIKQSALRGVGLITSESGKREALAALSFAPDESNGPAYLGFNNEMQDRFIASVNVDNDLSLDERLALQQSVQYGMPPQKPADGEGATAELGVLSI